jgi:hypothetical protein
MKQSDLFVANNPELTPRRQSILREELFSRNYYRPHTPPILTSAGLEAAIATGTPPVAQPPLGLGRYEIPGWGAAEYTGECQEQYEQICALAQPPAARYTRSTASAAVPEFELDDDGAASPELRQLTADLGVQPTPVDEDDGDEFRSLPASAAARRALRPSASSASSARPSLAVEVVQSPGVAAGSAASTAAAEPAGPRLWPAASAPSRQPLERELIDAAVLRYEQDRGQKGLLAGLLYALQGDKYVNEYWKGGGKSAGGGGTKVLTKLTDAALRRAPEYEAKKNEGGQQVAIIKLCVDIGCGRQIEDLLRLFMAETAVTIEQKMADGNPGGRAKKMRCGLDNVAKELLLLCAAPMPQPDTTLALLAYLRADQPLPFAATRRLGREDDWQRFLSDAGTRIKAAHFL